MDNHHAQYVTFEESGHVAYVCDGKHDNPYCQFCDGGLFMCTCCGSFEGATTTHCPNAQMTEQMRDAVYKGEWDYRNGWVKAGSPHTPFRGWELYQYPPDDDYGDPLRREADYYGLTVKELLAGKTPRFPHESDERQDNATD